MESLFLELVSQSANLSLVLDNLSGLALLNLEFALELTDLVLEKLDVLETLSILNLSLSKSDLEDLDLLVEESQLVISSDELGSKDISHVLDLQVILPLGLKHVDGLSDQQTELVDHGLSLLELVKSQLLLGLLGLELLLEHFEVLVLLRELLMLSHQGGFLVVNLILELMDGVLSNLELLSKLNNLVVGLDKTLTVQVTVGTDNLVQVLLLLELVLKVKILLLELANQVSLELDFLEHLHQVGVGLVGSLHLLLLVGL